MENNKFYHGLNWEELKYLLFSGDINSNQRLHKLIKISGDFYMSGEYLVETLYIDVLSRYLGLKSQKPFPDRSKIQDSKEILYVLGCFMNNRKNGNWKLPDDEDIERFIKNYHKHLKNNGFQGGHEDKLRTYMKELKIGLSPTKYATKVFRDGKYLEKREQYGELWGRKVIIYKSPRILYFDYYRQISEEQYKLKLNDIRKS